MPAKSQKQLKFIYAKRHQYGSKSKTPKKWKWVWNDEWLKVRESMKHLMKFESFDDFSPESRKSKTDRGFQIIEDLFTSLGDEYRLSNETDSLQKGVSRKEKIPHFNSKIDTYHSQIKANGSFFINSPYFENYEVIILIHPNKIDLEQFKIDLRKLSERIKKYTHRVLLTHELEFKEVKFDSGYYGYMDRFKISIGLSY